jgi:hypothetical protein
MQIARRLVLALAMAASLVATARAGTLVIESWRVDDKALWEGVLIPAFKKQEPRHRGQVLAHRTHRIRLQPGRAPDGRHGR